MPNAPDLTRYLALERYISWVLPELMIDTLPSNQLDAASSSGVAFIGSSTLSTLVRHNRRQGVLMRSILKFRGSGRSILPAVRRTVRWALWLALILPATASVAQEPRELADGVAWQVHGTWQIDGTSAPIVTGDPIPPGSLLRPRGEPPGHSIMVLLPDGQRVLYECFLAQDCGRAFRVPSLYRRPDPFAVNMLARIQAALSRRSRDAQKQPRQAPRVPRDEALAVIGPGNRVEVAGLAANLPNDHYICDLRPIDHDVPRQAHLPLEKSASSITLPLPGPGLYELTITDRLNTPRISLFIAAIKPEQAASSLKSYSAAKKLIGDWNIDYQGWPIHDFQRAYLESLVLGLKPQIVRPRARPAIRSADETAEPAFSPRPGVFEGDTAVTLRCATPGAVLHFTVDGSQPFASSPVYTAPIMVKGTELTIKAFATVPGKKDSPVVTGIFRIEE